MLTLGNVEQSQLYLQAIGEIMVCQNAKKTEWTAWITPLNRSEIRIHQVKGETMALRESPMCHMDTGLVMVIEKTTTMKIPIQIIHPMATTHVDNEMEQSTNP